VWYGGGKLAPDLAWPKLRQRWGQPATAGPRFTPAERAAIWDHAARVAGTAAAEIRAVAGINPAAAADAAWAASGTLHVAATALGSRVLRQAADAYDRAARMPYGRIPSPTPSGDRLRNAAWLLGTVAQATGDPALAPLMLLTRLAALADAVAQLRHAQRHAAQAAARVRPPNSCTPPPAAAKPHCGQPAVPGLRGSSRRPNSPSPSGPAGRHPDGQAPVRTGRIRHAAPHHPGRAARAAERHSASAGVAVPLTGPPPGFSLGGVIRMRPGPSAFPAARLWPARPARQGHSSSLRCGRSALTCGSPPAGSSRERPWPGWPYDPSRLTGRVSRARM